jgi:hypothetical protein
VKAHVSQHPYQEHLLQHNHLPFHSMAFSSISRCTIGSKIGSKMDARRKHDGSMIRSKTENPSDQGWDQDSGAHYNVSSAEIDLLC